jgi:hypothetical protein
MRGETREGEEKKLTVLFERLKGQQVNGERGFEVALVLNNISNLSKSNYASVYLKIRGRGLDYWWTIRRHNMSETRWDFLAMVDMMGIGVVFVRVSGTPTAMYTMEIKIEIPHCTIGRGTHKGSQRSHCGKITCSIHETYTLCYDSEYQRIYQPARLQLNIESTLMSSQYVHHTPETSGLSPSSLPNTPR